jgi:hypothetical protein
MRTFISYRRDDSSSVVGRIYDYLSEHFGSDAIFKDVDSIGLGADFREEISRALRNSDAVLIVIGQHWLDTTPEGERRIDDESDYVRIEIETAIQQGKQIIPVLVEGTKMPSAESLPDEIRELSFLNALSVRPDPDFRRDIERLIDALDRNTDALDQRDDMIYGAPAHQRAAMPLHLLIVSVFGILALASIAGGIYAISKDTESDTYFKIMGAELSTGHVGVALVGLGLLIASFTVRSVLKNQHDLASLP